MKRRDFLRNIGIVTGAGAVSFSIGGIPIKAFAKPFLNIKNTNGKILVLIQLKGGNDGLNTIIPFEDDIYYNQRSTLAIPKTSVVQLNNLTGLHPSLSSLKSLYDDGKMSVVQNVGYLNQNRSHFRSTDIWLTASDADKFVFDGWVGRYLEKIFPDYPDLPPEHPMAVQLGSVQSLVLESQYGGMGVTFEDPNTFYQLVNGITADNDPPPDTIAGDELKFLKEVAALSVQYASVIKEKADAGNNLAVYPDSGLATQLKIIADLIAGGLETPVYLATLDGFDTHAVQSATHANLLQTFADAVKSFQEDLTLLGIADKVVLMTFSEFGRRLAENGSFGTDHGAAAPMLLFGNNVNGGIFGANPDLNDLDNIGDIKFIYDFRQVYATVLKDHMNFSSSDLSQILFNEFETLPLFKTSTNINNENKTPNNFQLHQNYPNPFNPITNISFSLPQNDYVKLSIYDIQGKLVEKLIDNVLPAGNHKVMWNGTKYSSGIYFYTVTTPNFNQTKKMMLVK